MSKNEVFEILGEKIPLGKRREINFEIAKLHTRTQIQVPVIIERSLKPGPTVLITAGIHGDEINGVEIVRQIIAKGINKPLTGTIICIPVINIFGFLNLSRAFPDGRDLNRVFPGSKTGSLASQVAYKLMREIIPQVDIILDFHTGGADRFNAAQVRIAKDQPKLKKLASIFGAPVVYYSKNINKTFRNSCHKQGIPMLLFEGGKSHNINATITNTGVNGAKRILHHFGMLSKKFKVSKPKKSCVFISESSWQRAKYSGMFKASIKVNTIVKKGEVVGHITDPFGRFHHFVKASHSGYVFNVNETTIVYKGDALFHISTKFKK